MSFVDPVRVCNDCAAITEQETEFFDKKIKTLMNGRQCTTSFYLKLGFKIGKN